MVSFGQLINLLIAISSCIVTFYVTGQLVNFLSAPHKVQLHQAWIVNLLDNYSRLQSAVLPLMLNLSWSGLFILQHSFMKSTTLTNILTKIGLYPCERALFNIATSGCLYLLLNNWRIIPELIVWQVNVEESETLWWLFAITHAVSWMVVFGGLLMLDFMEFLGIKQVYFDISNMQHPMSYKSNDLKRLYSRVRHPSFLALTIILWGINLMTLDRLALAIVWTAYMFLGWSTDENDVRYSKYQMKRKRSELYNEIVH